jgi:hypothetical protein
MTSAARTDVGRGTYGPHQKHQAIHTIYHLPSFTVNGFALRQLCICKVLSLYHGQTEKLIKLAHKNRPHFSTMFSQLEYNGF